MVIHHQLTKPSNGEPTGFPGRCGWNPQDLILDLAVDEMGKAYPAISRSEAQSTPASVPPCCRN